MRACLKAFTFFSKRSGFERVIIVASPTAKELKSPVIISGALEIAQRVNYVLKLGPKLIYPGELKPLSPLT